MSNAPSPLDHRGPYFLSTDPALLQPDRILVTLQSSYWGGRTTAESLARAIGASLCFGVYTAQIQIGFARVVTDYTSIAWLSDIYIESDHQRQGLGVWLLERLIAHPDLQGLRRMALRTRDAHGLYARFGFTEINDPDRWMTRS